MNLFREIGRLTVTVIVFEILLIISMWNFTWSIHGCLSLKRNVRDGSILKRFSLFSRTHHRESLHLMCQFRDRILG